MVNATFPPDSKPNKTRNAAPKGSAFGGDLFHQLCIVAGLDHSGAENAVKEAARRLTQQHARSVQLVPDAGGQSMLVLVTQMKPGARSVADLRDVHMPGFSIQAAPEVDAEQAATQGFWEAIEALHAVFREAEDAQHWLNSPNPAFKNKKPVTALEEGRPRAITTVLSAAQKGVGL